MGWAEYDFSLSRGWVGSDFLRQKLTTKSSEGSSSVIVAWQPDSDLWNYSHFCHDDVGLIHTIDTIQYDMVYLRELKSWREGQLNLAIYGSKNEKIRTRNYTNKLFMSSVIISLDTDTYNRRLGWMKITLIHSGLGPASERSGIVKSGPISLRHFES